MFHLFKFSLLFLLQFGTKLNHVLIQDSLKLWSVRVKVLQAEVFLQGVELEWELVSHKVVEAVKLPNKVLELFIFRIMAQFMFEICHINLSF